MTIQPVLTLYSLNYTFGGAIAWPARILGVEN